MKLRIASLALIFLALNAAPAWAQSKTCDTGTGWYHMDLWDGYTIQLQPDSPGKCRISLVASTGEIYYRATGDEGHIEFAATGIDVNNDGHKDAVLEVRQGGKFRYAVLTPGLKPALQREILVSVPLLWEDRDGGGHIEIIGNERVFEGLDGISVDDSPHPFVYFRMKPDNTLYPVSASFWPEYEAEINRAKANLPKDGLYQLQGAQQTAADHEKTPQEERNLRDAKALALNIVLNYLYAGRAQDAWKFIAENWQDRDKDRIRQLILATRARGLYGEIARPVVADPIPSDPKSAPAQASADNAKRSSPAQDAQDKAQPAAIHPN